MRQDKPREFHCQNCGKDYIWPSRWRKYCPECSDLLHKENTRKCQRRPEAVAHKVEYVRQWRAEKRAEKKAREAAELAEKEAAEREAETGDAEPNDN